MKKIVTLFVIVQSSFLLAQTKTVVSPNGEKITINVNTVNTADNGLTKTGGNVQLGGNLVQPTTIFTNSNTLAIKGLQTGTASDNLVAIDPTTGILKISPTQTAYTEPWQVSNSTTLATLNTQNIYQKGNIGIGDFSSSNPLTNLEVRGSVRTGTPSNKTIGTNSFAGGTSSGATGTNSFAYGDTTTSSGIASFAGGQNSVASADNSFAYGNGATAGGVGAVAFGSSTSNGIGSFALGSGNVINSGLGYATAMGVNNIIYSTGPAGGYPGWCAFASGGNNKIYSQNSTALGYGNIMNSTVNKSQASVALGITNNTDGIASIAMGYANSSNAIASVALGSGNDIDANYAIGMGAGNKILTGADASVAIGDGQQINSGYSAFATGQKNIIYGTVSSAMGQNNIIGAAGNNSPNGTIIGYYGNIPGGLNGSTILTDASATTTVIATAANQFTSMFNGGYRLLTNRGNVTKGMTMDASGNVVFSGGVTSTGYTTVSDLRLKKDIQPLTGVLDNIRQLRGVNYYWKDASNGTDLQLGMIAQELEKVYPELVITNKNTGFKSVNYSQFTGVLLEGIKEQQNTIEDLKTEVDTLKKQIQEIKDLLKK